MGKCPEGVVDIHVGAVDSVPFAFVRIHVSLV